MPSYGGDWREGGKNDHSSEVKYAKVSPFVRFCVELLENFCDFFCEFVSKFFFLLLL